MNVQTAPESALIILYNILWMPTGMAGTTSGFTKAQAILDGMFSLYPYVVDVIG
jgi:hypothetical protein